MLKPSEIYKKGYNCAESLVKAHNLEANKTIPVRVCTALGGGCGVGSICGAVNAAAIIIGEEKGRDDSAGDKMLSKRYVQEFMKEINGRYGTHMCKELKAKGVTCAEIMDVSYDVVKEVLKKDL